MAKTNKQLGLQWLTTELRKSAWVVDVVMYWAGSAAAALCFYIVEESEEVIQGFDWMTDV
jgi:hypothetical protein